jgi:hypothetical protein
VERGSTTRLPGHSLLCIYAARTKAPSCRRVLPASCCRRYEHFVYGEGQHHCVAAPHVINIFSFSKAGRSSRAPVAHAIAGAAYPGSVWPACY